MGFPGIILFSTVLFLFGSVSSLPFFYNDLAQIQIYATKCMDELGCFPITSDFFHPLYRPVNLPPADREKIKTKFLVYTLDNPKTPFAVRTKDKRLLDRSGFDPKRKTKIIVHGWIDNQIFGDWMREFKDEYLLHGDYNVIIVDWSGGNSLPYTKAASNSRVVGAEIALLLNWLRDSEGLKLEDCHILGHSLGAHVAGYAGERLHKLGRITGLDPAEPYFQYLPPSVRLDPTDADFVDIIHTDSRSILLGGLGMSQLVGHVDFFPNNGHSQPGCKRDKVLDFVTDGLVGGARSFIACNHQRAVDFAQDSVNHHRCVNTGYACPSWDMFLQGRCADCGPKGDKCAQMGDKAPQHFFQHRNDSIQNQFYMVTGSHPPFCLYHYHVSIQLESTNAKDREGTLTLTLRGEEADEVFQLGNGEKVKLYHGSTYPFLVTTSTVIGEISSATFKWDAGFNLIPWVQKKIYLKSIRIVPMNIVDKSVREAHSRLYCATKKDAVDSRREVTFYATDIC